MSDLLPPNATPQERALSMATARMGLPDTALGIDTLWNPRKCPEALLPWLAWALAVDVWDADWPLATKRRVIEISISIRRLAGTVWAVRQALIAAGYADARLIEGLQAEPDSDGNPAHWAEFDLEVDLDVTKDVTTASTATLLRLLHNAKPASRHLRQIKQLTRIFSGIPVIGIAALGTSETTVMPRIVGAATVDGGVYCGIGAVGMTYTAVYPLTA